MIDTAAKRGQLIKHLEDAMAIADELEDAMTDYLIGQVQAPLCGWNAPS